VVSPLYVSDDVVSGRLRKVAAFDDEAFVTFMFDRHLRLRVQDLRASPGASPREIVQWLVSAYGQPVFVDQIDPNARAAWENLRASGLLRGCSERGFCGATVAGPAVRSTADWAASHMPDDHEPA
jgi:hypothetical protein